MTSFIITEGGDYLSAEDGSPLVIECSVLQLPEGRQGIGVAQPQSGTDFPLLHPSTDVRYLLADFHIAFDQPSDYTDAAAFKPPFRIYWLSGFGDVAPDYPIPVRDGSGWASVCHSESLGGSMSVTEIDCLPLPVHDHDIIVIDSDGRIVFDSTNPLVTHESRTWGDRLRVVVWRHPTAQFVSLVYHIAWSPNDYPPQQAYLSYFFPEEAVLDERAIYRLPKRVRSLTVVLDNLRKTAIDFVAGYNMRIAAGNTSEVDGKRRVTRVTFDATPGDGLGVYPDCETLPLNIGSINGIPASSSGDFYFAASDCYWIRQPTRLLDPLNYVSYPQIALAPGNVPTSGLPSPLAGTTKNAPGWPHNDDPMYAHLQFGNDCGPCCDCPDYVAVAEYMNTVRNKYQLVGKKLEGTRDLYHANRDRWAAAAACINQQLLRIRLLPQLCPFVDVAIQLCNHTEKCLNNVELVVDFRTAPDGGTAVEMPGYTFITGARLRPGSNSAMTDRYRMGGSWPTFTAFFDSILPKQSVSARFRLKFSNCGMVGSIPYALTGTLTGTSESMPLRVPPDNSIATATDTQTLNCPPPPGSVTDLLICACEK